MAVIYAAVALLCVGALLVLPYGFTGNRRWDRLTVWGLLVMFPGIMTLLVAKAILTLQAA